MLKINSAIMDLFYPVGTYYETSNVDFDPNVAWGGTWVLDSQGKVTVSQDTTDSDFDTLGETGGSKFLQNHVHYMGKLAGKGSNTSWGFPSEQKSNMGDIYTQTPVDTYGNAITTGNSGNLQPYVVVKRWHRTA